MRIALLALWLSLASSPALAQDAPEEVTFDAIHAPPAGEPLADPAEIDARTREVASLLRCPVCQGMSVADSREGTSLLMKNRVRELVAAGYSEDQILDYFIDAYGEKIVLRPDERHWLVWLGPLLGLAAGVGALAWLVRRSAAAPAAAPPLAPSAAPAAPGQAGDDPYRRRILEALEKE